MQILTEIPGDCVPDAIATGHINLTAKIQTSTGFLIKQQGLRLVFTSIVVEQATYLDNRN